MPLLSPNTLNELTAQHLDLVSINSATVSHYTSRSCKDTSPGVHFMSSGLLQLSAVPIDDQTHAVSTVGA